MADVKISALPASTTPLAGTEVVPLVQSSTTKKVSVGNLTAGRDTSFKTGTATPRNGAVPTAGSVLTGLTIFNDQDAATGDGVSLFLDHSYRTPGTQTRGVKLSSYSTTAFAGYIGAKLQVTAAGAFLESVDFQDNGNIKFSTGNLVQGTAAKGLDLSANTPAAGMTSQLLNWYEEGTWTPTDASGAGLTFFNVDAYYTRIGRMVYAYCRVTYPTTANTNAASIGGLPFTIQNSQAARQANITCTNQTTATFLFPIPNSTYGIFFNAAGAVTNASMSGSDNWVMFTYPAA